MGIRVVLFLALAVCICSLAEGYCSRRQNCDMRTGIQGKGHHDRPHGKYHQRVIREWGQWTKYGACSKTCGGGEQRRYRTCKTKPHGRYGRKINKCVGSSYSKRRCNQQYCPAPHNHKQE